MEADQLYSEIPVSDVSSLVQSSTTSDTDATVAANVLGAQPGRLAKRNKFKLMHETAKASHAWALKFKADTEEKLRSHANG